jgi:ABC-type multidrug transport system fused ATPase/permease subunit
MDMAATSVGPESSSDKNRSALASHFSSSRSGDEKITMVWKDINFYMLEKDSAESKFMKPEYRTKHILQNVNGMAESGQLLAIMGPTGLIWYLVS